MGQGVSKTPVESALRTPARTRAAIVSLLVLLLLVGFSVQGTPDVFFTPIAPSAINTLAVYNYQTTKYCFFILVDKRLIIVLNTLIAAIARWYGNRCP